MKPTNFTRTLLLAATVFFSVVTCMGQDVSSEQLVGTWTKSANGGTITFIFSDDNKTEVYFTGRDEADVYGSFAISGTQITFTDEGGDYSSDSPGTYEFKVSDSVLTLTVVDDPVNGRSMLVEGTWSKAIDAQK